MTIDRLMKATRPGRDEEGRQPWLFDMKPIIHAPAQFWGNPQGVADRRSVSGFFVADRRIFSSAAITVDGERPIPVSYSQLGEDASQLVLLPRNLEEEGWTPVSPLKPSIGFQGIPSTRGSACVIRSPAA
ncbi:amylo-alpha-1,6-glucosidase [Parascardovia denticolens IPLA 20019]|uniref:glycogen debranching N-terminal domain-containing protein n=1 Tax=Parascardovia denticolens TaxID=78258 RepID=UPI000266CCF8|nr:glycogen debranching N-terminal domain-containing protein [Parascardovia denticolens]EIT88797.1 amylo-alpha-1,6-glucosidase [Parascardovia denticolens IPLA 20019]